MKIMSYIQKTIYALFLLALFSGCTDEVIDGGGSSTPIEEGKLVNVKVALGKAGETTVMTRSNDRDSDEPEVDEEFLFLQYKDGKLVYAWYTEEDKDVTDIENSKDKDDIEGWGARGTVNIQLLSGEGYHVYVIANLELKKDYYEQTSFAKSDDDDNERGPVIINNETFSTEFGTEEALLAWRRNSSKFVEIEDKNAPAFEYDNDDHDGIDLDDDPVMFAVASNQSMGETSVYKYTKMATNPSIEGDRVNDMIDFAKEIPFVSISENRSICATLYQPYAKVALKIEAIGLKKPVKIESVTVKNCPLDYSLINGYNLASESDAFPREHAFKHKSGKSGFVDFFKDKLLSESMQLNETFEAPIYVFENMAGNTNKSFPMEDDKISPSSIHTYIEVKAKINEEDITYRFILGKDEDTNCNVERNVFYKVTMKLTGDGGINESSWRVIYKDKEDPKPDPEEPEISIASDLTRLDAHATVSPITFTNLKAGTYTLSIEKGNGSIKNHGGSLVAVVEGEGVVINEGNSGNNDSFTLDQDIEKVVLSYRQDSWFSEDQNRNSSGHNLKKPEDVAQANCNEYIVNVYLGTTKDKLIGQIEVKQYPPVVVYPDPLFEVKDGEEVPIESLNRWNTATYMERFEDDHDPKQEKWNIVDLNTQQLESHSYNKRLFDQNDKNSSEECYWLNLYGPLTLKGNGQKPNYKRVRSGEDVWPYSLSSSNKERYIIQL